MIIGITFRLLILILIWTVLVLSPPSSDARHMARDVQASLLQVIQEQGDMDAGAASEYIKKLQKRNRFLQDVWS